MNERRAFTPSPEQVEKWRKEFVDFGWSAYLRVKTEQATEIVELKAKLADVNRALQPELVDPHAALRAEYIRQRDAVPCELEFYLWERKDKGMADFAKLGVPPAFFPFHEYRCTDIRFNIQN